MDRETTRDRGELDRLRQSEHSYRNLAERSIQGFLVHDEAGRPLYANPAFARMLRPTMSGSPP